MKVVFHQTEDDAKRGGLTEENCDDCWSDNTADPVVREGGEPFKSCYSIEIFYYGHNLVDPSRSVAAPVLGILEEHCDSVSKWPVADKLVCLVYDFGIAWRLPTLGDAVAFQTIFPKAAGAALSGSWLHWSGVLEKATGFPRVLNNPFFHRDTSASERRLVDIAEENGVRFSLDLTKRIPAPGDLAREIALLLFGHKGETVVADAQRRLAPRIAETLDDWGLPPQAVS